MSAAVPLERVDAPDLALGPDDQLLAVGHPRKAGVDAPHRPDLLQVARQAAPGRALDAGGEVLQEQRALVAHAAHEGEVFAVRGGRRAHRAAGALHKCFDGTVRQVLPEDGVDARRAVLVVLKHAAGRCVLAVVQVLAVRREGWLAQVLLPARLLVELHALVLGGIGRVHGEQPDFARAGAAGAGVVLARQHEAAVRVPDRVVQQPEVFLGDGMRVAAVHVHDPDVVAAAGVGQERDLLAVRREAGLLLPGDGVRQRLGLAAADGQRVEVAQQVEHDRLAVGAHVHAHPGAGLHVDVGRLGHTRRRVDVPGRRLGRRGLLRVGRQRGGEEEGGDGFQTMHGSLG